MSLLFVSMHTGKPPINLMLQKTNYGGCLVIYEPFMRNLCFAYVKTKEQISCTVIVQLNEAFVFAKYEGHLESS